MKLSALLIGDILIEGAPNNGIHTMMFAGGKSEGLEGPSIVDAYAAKGQNGVALWEAATDGGFKKYFLEEQRLGGAHEVHVYRRSDQEVAKVAGSFARAWAMHVTKTPMPPIREPKRLDFETPGGKYLDKPIRDDRRIGVTLAQGGEMVPPFGYDAFYRALKWSTKMAHPFSINRGTTCCSFIVACFQAASLYHCSKSDPKEKNLKIALDNIREKRAPKPIFKPEQLIKTNSGNWISPVPTVGANPGSTLEKEPATELMNNVLALLTENPKLTFVDVFTPAICIDAQFTHTKWLSNRLNQMETRAGWAAAGLLEAD